MTSHDLRQISTVLLVTSGSIGKDGGCTAGRAAIHSVGGRSQETRMHSASDIRERSHETRAPDDRGRPTLSAADGSRRRRALGMHSVTARARGLPPVTLLSVPRHLLPSCSLLPSKSRTASICPDRGSDLGCRTQGAVPFRVGCWPAYLCLHSPSKLSRVLTWQCSMRQAGRVPTPVRQPIQTFKLSNVLTW